MLQPKFPDINFIGNKDRLSTWILDYIPSDTKTVFDAFSGGGSIGYEAKKRGYEVTSNDILKTNALLSVALIENSAEILDEDDIVTLFSGTPLKGFMYREYANVYFFPEECMQLDQYRENVKKLPSAYKQALALSLLRRSMIRKMPYSRFTINWETIKLLRDEDYSYKKYGRRRAYHNRTFKEHILEALPSYNEAVFNTHKKHHVYNIDTFELLGKVKADLIYLDPPYSGTMNNYFGFYGVLDEYVVSKRLEPFNNNFVDKKKALQLFDELFSKLGSYRYWLMSYNNSSYPKKEELVALLKKYAGSVAVVEKDHQYKITGKDKKDVNKEYLFVVENLRKYQGPMMLEVGKSARRKKVLV